MAQEHKTFDGCKVRIPNPMPGWVNPNAGKLGDVVWAGWGDQYLVYIDGVYFVRCSADELAPNIVSK